MDLNAKYEAKHKANIKKLQKKINKHYQQTIDKIFKLSGALKLKSENFKISDYPTISKEINNILASFSEQLYLMLVNGVKLEWDFSKDKNASIVLDTYGASKVSDTVKELLYNPQQKALDAFINRKTQGLGLSDRVWKYTNQFRSEIEQGLYVGLSEGKSAAEMARNQKQYLQQPDKLFRRIKDAKGNLTLSKAAQQYKPGQGVYRSSYKNALRLTRTIVNDSYRESDIIRYQSLPFVNGYEIKLSDQHPKYDICDVLKGNYPKTFIWRKWHPQCMCFCVSRLPSKEEYDKYEDAILNGTADNFKFSDVTKEVNPAVKDYLKDNSSMLARLKRKPDWIKDNKLEKGEKPNIIPKENNTLSNVNKIIKQNKDTSSFYSDSLGNYNQDRTDLHKNIINEYLSNGSTKDGVSYFMGGAPANGKSTLIDSGLLPHPKKILTVDSDAIKAKIPDYNVAVKNNLKEAAAIVHEESSMLSKQIIKNAGRNNYDIVLDGVNDGSLESIIKKANEQKILGKRVRADYVTLDTDLSVKLAEARAKKTGREVPLKYIKDMNKEVSKLMPDIIKNNVFDELYLWDTNVNGKPRLILNQINGKLKIHDQELYKRFLNKAN